VVGPVRGSSDEEVERQLPPGSTRAVLDEAQARRLARWGRRLEAEWAHPVDVEWAIDGPTGELVLLQCRPLVGGRGRADDDRTAGAPEDPAPGAHGRVLARGLAVGTGTAGGVARRVDDPLDADAFRDGDVLVTASTDPGWLTLMQRAGALVTDHGGRTSHAAIVSRELGLLAVVGCGRATRSVHDGTEVGIACTSNGLGVVYGADESGDKSSPAGGVTVP
jgi:pyruvate,water dikinase